MDFQLTIVLQPASTPAAVPAIPKPQLLSGLTFPIHRHPIDPKTGVSPVMSAYDFYVCKRRAEISNEGPAMPLGQVAAYIAAEWSCMMRPERRQFEIMSEMDQTRYQHELALVKATKEVAEAKAKKTETRVRGIKNLRRSRGVEDPSIAALKAAVVDPMNVMKFVRKAKRDQYTMEALKAAARALGLQGQDNVIMHEAVIAAILDRVIHIYGDLADGGDAQAIQVIGTALGIPTHKLRDVPNAQSLIKQTLDDAYGLRTVTKKVKDPTAPNRNLSAYLYYASERRPELKKEDPTMPFGDLTKQIAAEWHQLKDAGQIGKWVALAEADKKRYEQELQAYMNRPAEVKAETKKPTREESQAMLEMIKSTWPELMVEKKEEPKLEAFVPSCPPQVYSISWPQYPWTVGGWNQDEDVEYFFRDVMRNLFLPNREHLRLMVLEDFNGDKIPPTNALEVYCSKQGVPAKVAYLRSIVVDFIMESDTTAGTPNLNEVGTKNFLRYQIFCLMAQMGLPSPFDMNEFFALPM